MTVSSLVPISGALAFDVEKIAAGFVLPAVEVEAYFRDGRRFQPLALIAIKRALAENGWSSLLLPGGGLGLRAPDGLRWDVRVLVERLSFAPSWMKGKGRRFEPLSFDRYMANLGGVFVLDAQRFGRCPYWRVSGPMLLEWFRSGVLGVRAEVKRGDLAGILEGFEP